MKLLTAINLMLPKLGEHQVTSLDTKHPTLAIILPIIQQELEKVLLPGLWFNDFKIKLYPSSEGEIVVPQECLSFIPKYEGAIKRGNRLYNSATMNYKWTTPVEGQIKVLVPFDELPESVAQYVFYSACIVAYTTDIGVEEELRVWQIQAGAAESAMMQEHLRNKRYSTRSSRRYQNYRRALRG